MFKRTGRIICNDLGAYKPTNTYLHYSKHIKVTQVGKWVGENVMGWLFIHPSVNPLKKDEKDVLWCQKRLVYRRKKSFYVYITNVKFSMVKIFVHSYLDCKFSYIKYDKERGLNSSEIIIWFEKEFVGIEYDKFYIV